MQKNLSYKKGLWISDDRTIVPFFFFETIGIGYESSNLNILNEINTITSFMVHTRELNSRIQSVLSGLWEDTDESTNLTDFRIRQEVTVIHNYLFDYPDVHIETKELSQIIADKLLFVESLNEELVLQTIRVGMDKIKLNPVKDLGNYYSIYSDDGLFLQFGLSEKIEDINVNEFIAPLKLVIR